MYGRADGEMRDLVLVVFDARRISIAHTFLDRVQTERFSNAPHNLELGCCSFHALAEKGPLFPSAIGEICAKQNKDEGT